MKILYKSLRVGKNGRVFEMLKFRTLKEGVDKVSTFAQDDQYLPLGKFLRKTKLDELPQLWNVIKGEMAICGPRPEEERSIKVIPEDIRNIILSVKPGMVDLASLHFFDEEKLIQRGSDPAWTYWTQVKPAKILLQVFYIQNRGTLLNIWLMWQTMKKVIKSFFK